MNHGGVGRVVARTLGLDPSSILDLSASLNPFVGDLVADVVADVIGEGALDRYPDLDDVAAAETALAATLGVDPGRILLTNGGAEAIAVVAADVGSGWVEEPEFSLYRRHLHLLDPEGPRFRSDPQNPLGSLAGDGETAAVWDEAFYPLSTGRWRAPGRHSSIVLGSLTKTLACPGLRVGWVIAPVGGDQKARLAARQPAWSVGTPALVALPRLLEAADRELAGWSGKIVSARGDLIGVLAEAGLSARPSQAPWVLVEAPDGLWESLARHGVVVRECSSFGMPGILRIAVPDGPGLDRLAGALSSRVTVR